MALTIRSSAFGSMGPIPSKHTCDGRDISPELSWSGVPSSAKSLVLICDDPDAPMGTWVHWVCYDIPVSVTSLSEAVPGNGELVTGGTQGLNDFKKIGYGGPCPPSGTHRYFFKLYALDTTLDLHSGRPKSSVVKAMKGHILAEAELVGTYSRQR